MGVGPTAPLLGPGFATFRSHPAISNNVRVAFERTDARETGKKHGYMDARLSRVAFLGCGDGLCLALARFLPHMTCGSVGLHGESARILWVLTFDHRLG